jgi:DNA modification methylase
MRYLALKKAGAKECTAKIVTGLTPEQKREFVIKDNSGFGNWDMDALANAWGDLPLADWGVDLPDDWLGGVSSEPQDAEPQIDKAAELNKIWKVKTGDLWQIGEHRLLCGDSTKKEDVGRVMGGEKARLCFTSPMYANARDYNSGKFDYMEIYKKFSEIAFSLCDDVLINLGLLHKEGRVFRYWDEWLNYCEQNGNKLFGWYVWDQLSGMPGDYHGRLARSHEWVFHFSQKHSGANKWIETTGESLKRGTKGKRFRQKDGSLKELGSPDTIGQPYKIPDSVIRVRREMVRGIHTETHPAVFPVEFPSFGIQTWSKENEIIYEPFCGSGTTMVACQNLNRKCRGIEISPEYCSVILQRMHDAFPNIEIKRLP